MNQGNGTPKLMWWDRLLIQLHHRWVHLPYVRRNLLSVQAKLEFDGCIRDLAVRPTFVERISRKGWPWLAFLTPAILVGLAVLLWGCLGLPAFPLPVGVTEIDIGSARTMELIATVLASLSAVLIAIVVFSLGATRHDVFMRESRTKFVNKMGFIPATALLAGGVFAAVLARASCSVLPYSSRADVVIALLTPFMVSVPLLLRTLWKSSLVVDMREAVSFFIEARNEDTLAMILFAHERSKLKNGLMKLGFSAEWPQLQIAPISQTILLYGDRFNSDVYWPAAAQLAQCPGCQDSDQQTGQNENGRSRRSKRRIGRLVGYAFLIPEAARTDRVLVWRDFGDYMTRLVYRHDMTLLEHSLDQFSKAVEYLFNVLERVERGFFGWSDCFLDGIPYAPPDLYALNYARVMESSIRVNDRGLLGLVFSLLNKLVWLAIDHRSPEYMAEVLGYSRRFYDMGQEATEQTKTSAVRLFERHMVEAQRKIRTAVVRETESWFRSEQLSRRLLVTYLIFPLELAKEAAEAGNEERFGEWLNTINGFTWKANGLTYALARLEYLGAKLTAEVSKDKATPETQSELETRSKRARMKLEAKRIECMPDLVLCSWFLMSACENMSSSPTDMRTYLRKAAKYFGETPDLMELYFYYIAEEGKRIVQDLHCGKWHVSPDFPGPDFPGTSHGFGPWWDKWIPQFVIAHALKTVPAEPPGPFDTVETFVKDIPQAFASLKHEVSKFKPSDTMREWYLKNLDLDDAKIRLINYLDGLEKVTIEAQEKSSPHEDSEAKK